MSTDQPDQAVDPTVWQRALLGDRDAFEASVAPHREALTRAARTSIETLSDTEELPTDTLNAEELVGETLLRAFDGRDNFPIGKMRMLSWLLSLQQRALTRIASDENQYRSRKAFSLDEEVAEREDIDGIDDGFFGAVEPFAVTTYEDILPASMPDDIEVDARRSLTKEELQFLEDAGLDPSGRQIVELHDEFDLPISDVAQVLERSLHDVAESLNQARVHVRQWLGTAHADGRSNEDD